MRSARAAFEDVPADLDEVGVRGGGEPAGVAADETVQSVACAVALGQRAARLAVAATAARGEQECGREQHGETPEHGVSIYRSAARP